MVSIQAAHNTGAQTHISNSEIPQDVLLYIFKILRDNAHRGYLDRVSNLDSEHLGNHWHKDDALNWTVVSKVCRRWRFIAVECPSLWTNIHGFRRLHPDQIRTFLERSVHAELDISIRMPSYGWVEILALFEGHMWRVRALKLAASRTVMDSMVPLLSQLTWHAKTLDLAYVRDINEYEGVQYVHLMQNLPEMIPNVQLDTLSMDNLAIPWTSSLYYGLSELSIIGMNIWDIFLPTFQVFIDVLGHCPNLKCLKLDNSFGDAGIYDIEQRRLHLPQLRRIALANIRPLICSKILAMFTINANVDLDIVFSTGFDDSEMFRLPPNVLIERNECKTINIVLEEEFFILQSDLDSNSHTGPSKIYIKYRFYHHTQERTIHTICAFLEDQFWQRAEDVSILFNVTGRIHDVHMGTSFWFFLLDRLPKQLRRLTVKFSRRNYAGYYVGLPDSLSGTTSYGLVRLAELEKLTVFYAEFQPVFVRERQAELFERMEERSRHTLQACRVSVLNQQMNRADKTLYTAVEIIRVFEPISGAY